MMRNFVEKNANIFVFFPKFCVNLFRQRKIEKSRIFRKTIFWFCLKPLAIIDWMFVRSSLLLPTVRPGPGDLCWKRQSFWFCYTGRCWRGKNILFIFFKLNILNCVSWNNIVKESGLPSEILKVESLSLELKFSDPYILTTWLCKPLII